MKENDQVALGNLTVTVLKMPRSEGRKRPRVLVSIEGVDRWVFLDELKELTNEAE